MAASCSDVDAAVWLIPYAPTSTGGYQFPKTHVGPYVGTGERQFYFTPNYWTANTAVYQELADYVHAYYTDAAAFNNRNDWLNDSANVNTTCPTTDLDFGDAPDTSAAQALQDYSTAYQFNGPRHTGGSDIYMGTAPTVESDAYATLAANGDADDGVVNLPLLPGATVHSATITVTNNSGNSANLYAWFDWNQNGDFELSERQTIAVANGTTDQEVVLTWPITTTVNESDSFYARFRICDDTTSCDTQFGGADNGEVEDYLVPVLSNVDFGDAPDTFFTLPSSGGAYHLLGSNLYLGDQIPDSDAVIVPSELANSDDTNASPDDEDALNIAVPIDVNSTSYQLTVEATNLTVNAATLWAWIDFNLDGNFETSEAQYVDVSAGVNQGQFTLTWNGLSGLTPGVAYVRLRISSDSLTASDWGGEASDGEVEDHRLVIGLFDLGDAPDTYGTDRINANGEGVGASHTAGTTIFLGDVAPDDEADGFVDGIDNNGDARDDDLAGDDDEDGVTIPALLLAQPTTNVSLPVKVNTDVDATVYAWLDFNRDGSFDTTLEAATPVAITSAENGSTQSLDFTVPNFVLEGGTYVRVRICSTATVCSTPHGAATDGEVEDYRIELNVLYDYGDLPQTAGYQTLFDNNGPRHRLGNANIYLGNTIADEDSDGFGDGTDTNGDATDDDTKGIGDDEDGLDGAELVATDTGYSLAVICNDHDGSTDLGANVYGWIDFNNDGDFTDSGEFSSTACNDTSNTADGSGTLQFSGFSSSQYEMLYARIRITTDTMGNTQANDDASNGEVEDYRLIPFDFGDAPDTTVSVAGNNYRTLINGDGPRHRVRDDLYLGTLLTDRDDNAQDTSVVAKASGDDNSNNNDEDGVVLAPLSATSTSYRIKTTTFNNTGNPAYLYAWIDSDRNGRFDRDEFFSNGSATGGAFEVSSSAMADAQELVWTSTPSGLVNNTDIYIRVRLTTELLTDTVTGAVEDPRSYGEAIDGEVEDHYLRVGNYDLGDLPDSFKTKALDGGPYHALVTTNLYIRSNNIDNDTDGVPTDTANGDDLANNDDENADDLAPLPILTLAATNYTVGVPLYNGSGSSANLYGWLDINQDGDFDDSGEFAELTGFTNGTNSSTQTSPTTQLTWGSISGQVTGKMALRLRITNDTLMAADFGGYALNGEVEDHFVLVGDPDFGDAPDATSATAANNYQTQFIHFGAYQLLTSDLYLGYKAADVDDGTLHDATATADNLDNIDDEGPIILPPLFNGISSYKISIPATNNTGANATVAAWIDFNRNGKFEDSEGQLAIVPTGVSNIPVEIEWDAVPAVSNNTTSFIRLRITDRFVADISQISSLGGDGLGEVEDYAIFFGLQDLGDAPVQYGVDPLNNGPHHIISNAANLYLGSSNIDGDTTVPASADALGDDDVGDDENGAAQPLLSVPVGGQSYQIDLNVRNTTGSDAYLAGWIDANRNGSLMRLKVELIP